MSYDVDLLNGFTMIVMDYIDEDPLAKQKITSMSYNARKTIMKNSPQKERFELCERYDIDRYPVTMSTEISWPQGANPGALLMQVHDGNWLQVLKHDLNL
ncbi:unnamed protein product [Rhizophagus irregularis]|nr:unnamed protein product [Rhizophagus irregularis]CAB5212258.1 unnamed protein product [Rhizophagus irregularis]